MAILESNETQSRGGIRKELDEASQEVILDIVQVALYRYPFQSMIRETVSNSLDANAEKVQATLIKTGQAKVTDFYAEPDHNSKIQVDSLFNAEYYDVKHLNPENKVTLNFHIHPNPLGRDLMCIKDTGVGLGGRRLVKFFTPGSSSKRLNKKALGKYGIGNKSPLASGIESYYMTTTYNGKRTTFEIRKDKFDIITPKFNKAGNKNPFYNIEGFVDMSDRPVNIYYEETTDKNSVEILIPVKKTNSNTVIDAVASQLMYFKDDIVLTKHTYQTEEGFDSRLDSKMQVVPFKAKVLYEDDDLIIPDGNTYYNRPHFVMNGVSYGLIDWSELELSPRHGNVGLKFDVAELDVTPARESVQYTEKTKAAILKKYEILMEKIKSRMQLQLNTTAFLPWTRTANSIIFGKSGSESEDKVLAKMSSLVSSTDVDFDFTSPSGLKLKYAAEISKYLGKNLDGRRLSFNTYSKKVENRDSDSTLDLSVPSYLQFGKSISATTVYLGHLHKTGCFIMRVKVLGLEDEIYEWYKKGCSDADVSTLVTKYTGSLTIGTGADAKEKFNASIKGFKDTLHGLKVLKEANFSVYDQVVVPEDFKPEEVGTAEAKEDAVDLQKLRKAQGKMLFYTPGHTFYSYADIVKPTSAIRFDCAFIKHEILKSDLPKEKGEDDLLFYGNEEDREALIAVSRIHLYKEVKRGTPVSKYNVPGSSSGYYYYDFNVGDYKVMKVAKTLNKSMDLIGAKHISQYGYQINNKILQIDKHVVEDNLMKVAFETMGVFALNRVRRTAKAISHLDDKYYKILSTITEEDAEAYVNYKSLDVYKYITYAISYEMYKLNNPDKIEDELKSVFTELGTKLLGKELASEITEIKLEDDTIEKITDFYAVALELTELHGILDTHINTLFPDVLTSSGYGISDMKKCQKYMNILLDFEKPNLTREYRNLINY